jgi:hypothetical protein
MIRDFIAIDFETANQQPSSVCSVGVVIVRNRQVADSAGFHVRTIGMMSVVVEVTRILVNLVKVRPLLVVIHYHNLVILTVVVGCADFIVVLRTIELSLSRMNNVLIGQFMLMLLQLADNMTKKTFMQILHIYSCSTVAYFP